MTLLNDKNYEKYYINNENSELNKYIPMHAYNAFNLP